MINHSQESQYPTLKEAAPNMHLKQYCNTNLFSGNALFSFSTCRNYTTLLK